VKVNRFIQFVT